MLVAGCKYNLTKWNPEVWRIHKLTWKRPWRGSYWTQTCAYHKPWFCISCGSGLSAQIHQIMGRISWICSFQRSRHRRAHWWWQGTLIRYRKQHELLASMAIPYVLYLDRLHHSYYWEAPEVAGHLCYPRMHRPLRWRVMPYVHETYLPLNPLSSSRSNQCCQGPNRLPGPS